MLQIFQLRLPLLHNELHRYKWWRRLGAFIWAKQVGSHHWLNQKWNVQTNKGTIAKSGALSRVLHTAVILTAFQKVGDLRSRIASRKPKGTEGRKERKLTTSEVLLYSILTKRPKRPIVHQIQSNSNHHQIQSSPFPYRAHQSLLHAVAVDANPSILSFWSITPTLSTLSWYSEATVDRL